MECRVNEVKPLGDVGGSGNLVICEVLALHVSEEILDPAGAIDPNKLDAVARLGGAWYSRASGDSLFQIPKPLRTKGIGVDQLPEEVRNSAVLTGNNIGRLANVEELPSADDVKEMSNYPAIMDIKRRFLNDRESYLNHLHELAKDHLERGDVEAAWRVLLQ